MFCVYEVSIVWHVTFPACFLLLLVASFTHILLASPDDLSRCVWPLCLTWCLFQVFSTPSATDLANRKDNNELMRGGADPDPDDVENDLKDMGDLGLSGETNIITKPASSSTSLLAQPAMLAGTWEGGGSGKNSKFGNFQSSSQTSDRARPPLRSDRARSPLRSDRARPLLWSLWKKT